jgi:hypothetical protein
VKIRLNGTRTNPHILTIGGDVAKKKFMETFGKVIRYKHNEKN